MTTNRGKGTLEHFVDVFKIVCGKPDQMHEVNMARAIHDDRFWRHNLTL